MALLVCLQCRVSKACTLTVSLDALCRCHPRSGHRRFDRTTHLASFGRSSRFPQARMLRLRTDLWVQQRVALLQYLHPPVCLFPAVALKARLSQVGLLDRHLKRRAGRRVQH
jgi:hypothetical protein